MTPPYAWTGSEVRIRPFDDGVGERCPLYYLSMAETHWNTTALPILEYCVVQVMNNEDPPSVDRICEQLDMDLPTVQTALKLLVHEGYVEAKNAWGGPIGVAQVCSSGFRAVGQWPSSNNEVFGNAMVEALEKLASGERDEEKSQALRAAATDVRAIGVNGAGQVLGSFVKGLVGLG